MFHWHITFMHMPGMIRPQISPCPRCWQNGLNWSLVCEILSRGQATLLMLSTKLCLTLWVLISLTPTMLHTRKQNRIKWNISKTKVQQLKSGDTDQWNQHQTTRKTFQAGTV